MKHVFGKSKCEGGKVKDDCRADRCVISMKIKRFSKVNRLRCYPNEKDTYRCLLIISTA